MTYDHDTWIEAIVAAPADEVLRLAFSDWLEERGEYDACGRVRETVKIRPENRHSAAFGWAVWNPDSGMILFLEPEDTNGEVVPQWLYDALPACTIYPHGRWAKRWRSEQEGMRAIIEAILKGGPTWQPSSCGQLTASGSSGAGALSGSCPN